MTTIPAAKFKAKCLAVLDDVQSSRQSFIITKRGKPVAKLVPLEDAKDDLLGRLEGIVRITGDIESPVVPLEAWDALK